MENVAHGFVYQPSINRYYGTYSLDYILNLIDIPITNIETKMKFRYMPNSESFKEKIRKILCCKWSEFLNPLGKIRTIENRLKKSKSNPIVLKHPKEVPTFIDNNLSLVYTVIISVNFDYNEGDSAHWIVVHDYSKYSIYIIDFDSLSSFLPNGVRKVLKNARMLNIQLSINKPKGIIYVY